MYVCSVVTQTQTLLLSVR